MTRAKKQLSKRNNMGAGDLRKSVRFDGPVPCQSDFRAGQNAEVGDEDILEVHDDKEDSLPKDVRALSLASPWCISMSTSQLIV